MQFLNAVPADAADDGLPGAGPALWSAQRMRAAERAVMGSGAASGRELMERAGAAVVAAIFRHWPEMPAGRAVVLCGPGNNGGDGYVIARLLAARGWAVDLHPLGGGAAHGGAAHGDAGAMAAAWDGPLRSMGDVFDAAGELWIDALFGTGLSRPVSGVALAALGYAQAARERGARLVAVDLPSGLCADSGRALGRMPHCADLTVSFARPRPGHVLAEGPARCGALAIADIGIDHAPAAEVPDPRLVRLDAGAAAVLRKSPEAHKYGHGHALVLSGGPGRTGAARLAARAALRVGAGLVTLGVPPSAQLEAASQLTAVMLAHVPEAEALAELLQDQRLNALCLGPGLGRGARERGLVAAALAARRGTVLDADALTLFEDAPEELFTRLHERCVLTPHGGEFARLFPDLAERMSGPARQGPAYSRLDAAREAAARSGAVVLLKGPDTVIAAPDGRALVQDGVYDRAAPWLATAGSGDVLGGIITGLMARGIEPLAAAGLGAALHAAAARRFGPGLIAEDLPEALPGVLGSLPLD